MIATNERCDLCASDRLELAYKPPTSMRGLAVFVCKKCGLVQSLPRIDHVSSRNVAISGGANWGNIRYGKSFLTDRAITLLTSILDLGMVCNCLDVGANRGSFVLRLHEIAPQANILAVEPDGHIVSDYVDIPGIELVVDRIENVSLPDEQFDLVYCSHTLEHLKSPRQSLVQIRQAMTYDGLLYLEVPNLNFIARKDIVEEWFIDKHLYHFSPEALRNYLRWAGFHVVRETLTQDEENITFIASKSDTNDSDVFGYDSQLAQRSMKMIKQYQAIVHNNQSNLQNAARYIERLASSQQVVVWGGGRIFDSLVRYGELDVTMLDGVVDKYLTTFVGSVHGCPLLSPADIPVLAPEVVVIASRVYFNEIKHELLAMIPNCDVLGLDDLLGLATNSMPKK